MIILSVIGEVPLVSQVLEEEGVNRLVIVERPDGHVDNPQNQSAQGQKDDGRHRQAVKIDCSRGFGHVCRCLPQAGREGQCGRFCCRAESRLADNANMIQVLEDRSLLSLMVSVDKNVLIVRGTPGNDLITVSQTPAAIVVNVGQAMFSVPPAGIKSLRIDADAGNDRVILDAAVALSARVIGGLGNDLLVGSDSTCTLSGNAGSDTLRGGWGNDVLNGGPGRDTVDYSQRTTALRIILDKKANDGAVANLKGVPEKDNVGDDCEIIIGGSGDDRITGNNLNNTLIGGPGNDSLYGSGGNDVLSGGVGNDLLSGGPGDDILLSADLSSADTLDGGEGDDAHAIDSVLGIEDSVVNCETELSVLLS
jgi:hypothetical protein